MYAGIDWQIGANKKTDWLIEGQRQTGRVIDIQSSWLIDTYSSLFKSIALTTCPNELPNYKQVT